MRALFSFASLVIVLCVVTVAVQHQLRATRSLQVEGVAMPASGVSPASVAQYKSTLDATLQQGAAGRGSATEAAEAQQPQR
jgi:hypothetical protein